MREVFINRKSWKRIKIELKVLNLCAPSPFPKPNWAELESLEGQFLPLSPMFHTPDIDVLCI